MTEHPLPDNLFSEVTRLLLPHMSTIDEREAWLTQAFYIRERRLYDQMVREGAPMVFTVRCIKTLLDFGCLPGGKHALSVLLDTLRLAYGIQEQQAIDRLVQQLDALCVERVPEYSIPASVAPPVQPLQTIHTPTDQRTPTVFVSYAHSDKDLVQRLIADLQSAGHACWIDTTGIKGGDEWTRAITEGINNSYAFVTVVSAAANGSKWVQREFLWAEGKHKPIFPVLVEDCGLPIYMIDLQYTPLHPDYDGGLPLLLRALPAPAIPLPDDSPVVVNMARPANQRALELEYLDYLRLNELLHTEKYTPLAGTAHVHEQPKPSITPITPVVIRPEFEHLRRSEGEQPHEVETRKFEDIITAIDEIRRAVVLGEPGAGKTTTLWKLAKNLVDKALDDPAAPIPVLVRLGSWTKTEQPLQDFIAGELGGLGLHLDDLLRQKRAVLLLDGLNEIPVSQREDKAQQVQRLFQTHPNLTAVVTCREQDYTLDLGLDRIVITPLDPLRIHEFVTRYLGDEQGNELFWRLAGETARQYWLWFTEKYGEEFERFWTDGVIAVGQPGWWGDWILKERWFNPYSLLTLAQNPYMLLMMTDIYAHDGELSSNRSEMFNRFVDTLLAREQINVEANALLKGLAQTAYLMQFHRQLDGNLGSVTVIARQEVAQFLEERQLYLANSASILSVDKDSIRFTHQLLQEYFAALHLRYLVERVEHVTATEFWPPEKWWQYTNWEEAAILLTGLYRDDCSRVVEWVAAANPEVAAQCIVRSGALTPPQTLERLRAAWIPRLTDLEHNPEPEARAAVGRALGLLNMDNRPGVGLRPDGLPDIDWMEIPAGEFIYQDGERLTLPTFYIARYPVTYTQFQIFLDAPDGFELDDWWKGITPKYQRQEMAEQSFRYANHPRENVSWYQAMAFCRWLSNKLGYEIRLPTEQEWEKSARGMDGRKFPWGNEYILGFANVNETIEYIGPHYIECTTAVGIYLQGASPYGVLDISGNVLEWCLTRWRSTSNSSEDLSPEVGGPRVLRGGSWGNPVHVAQTTMRTRNFPESRNPYRGFRVCTMYYSQ